jgi:hypothetical protein
MHGGIDSLESISGLRFELSLKLLFTLQKLLNVVSVFQLSPPARGGGRGRGRRVVSFLTCLCNVHLQVHYSRAGICKPFEELRNRFPAWQN